MAIKTIPHLEFSVAPPIPEEIKKNIMMEVEEASKMSLWSVIKELFTFW